MKKIYINPVVYIFFVLAVIVAATFIIRIFSNFEYVNISQEIATYIMALVTTFGVFYIGKVIIIPSPLSYNNKEIKIKRLFNKDIVLSYHDLDNAEYYNRYMVLILYFHNKKHKFPFVVKTTELREILRKKFKNSNL